MATGAVSGLKKLGQHVVVRRAPQRFGFDPRSVHGALISVRHDEGAISCADDEVGVRQLRDASRALRLGAPGVVALRERRQRSRAGTRAVAHRARRVRRSRASLCRRARSLANGTAPRFARALTAVPRRLLTALLSISTPPLALVSARPPACMAPCAGTHVVDELDSAFRQRKRLVLDLELLVELLDELVLPATLSVGVHVACAVHVSDFKPVSEASHFRHRRDVVRDELHERGLGLEIEYGKERAERVRRYRRPVRLVIRDERGEDHEVDRNHDVLEHRDWQLERPGDVAHVERSAPRVAVHVAAEAAVRGRLLSCCVTKDVPLHDVRRHCRSLRAEHRIGECAGACGESVDPFSSAIHHAVREAVP